MVSSPTCRPPAPGRGSLDGVLDELLAVTLTARLPGLDRSTAEQLVKATHEVCPNSNATRVNIEVSLKATVR